MGVPAFFRWLCKKYPSIVVQAVEEKPKKNPYTDEKIPINTAEPNPNNVEFDNLYLDMNGIIHPCTHPEDRPAPKNEDEMMIIIFEFIDRLFSIVRPRKLLYMAIDGVAPRAKMNQQRSRRFRAAKDAIEKQNEIRRLRTQIIANGGTVPSEKPNEERFDSNCITPGTPFMHKLAQCLRYYIHDRLNNDPGWKNVKVILSDANVPGEGEHKIMDFIRRQRSSPDHDPNTHHVLCGADADLIMLGLATHEPYFTIIREEFRPDKPKTCEICNQYGHETKDCTGCIREKQGKHDEFANGYVPTETNYIFLRLSVLREYLQRELNVSNIKFKFDIERAIDDWVFMCFFVGNDFLPHLPSLEIREGAIDRLVSLYKNCLPKLDGYLTDNGYVNLIRAKIILAGIGEVEDDIFKKRQQKELEYKKRLKESKRRKGNNGDNMPNKMPEWMKTGPFKPNPIRNVKQETVLNSFLIEVTETEIHGKSSSKRKYDSEDEIDLKVDIIKNQSINTSIDEKSENKFKETYNTEFEEMDDDPVRLWEDGWRQRYYKVKFDVDENDLDFRFKVAEHYVIGLSWVLRYYYQGVPAWNWYFPFHYAPFASDFVNIDKIDVIFDQNTEPFKPFEQLMAVFPSASKNHVPIAYQKLMFDSESEIIDFYPEDFQIDLNGKKQSWQGVALLPFVDEKRLKNAIKPFNNNLCEEEKKRNIRGNDFLFVHKSHKVYNFLKDKIYSCNDDKLVVSLMPELNDGMSGQIWLDENYPVKNSTFIKSPLSYLCADLQNNQVISVKFKDPQFDCSHVFKSCLLNGVIIPEPTLKPSDLNNGQDYRPHTGFNRDYSFAQNRNTTVAHRMLLSSLTSSEPQNESCVSSAYGGHNSSYYGSYRTNSYSNNNNYNNERRIENQNRFQQQQYGNYRNNNNNNNNNYNNIQRNQFNNNRFNNNYNQRNNQSWNPNNRFTSPNQNHDQHQSYQRN